MRPAATTLAPACGLLRAQLLAARKRVQAGGPCVDLDDLRTSWPQYTVLVQLRHGQSSERGSPMSAGKCEKTGVRLFPLCDPACRPSQVAPPS